MRRWIRKLSSQIFLAQLVILIVSMTAGFALLALTERGNLDNEFQARAAAIAQTFAQIPTIRDCIAADGARCGTEVQDLASATAKKTSSTYVVVIDMNRVRHSHPNPALIGQKVREPIVVRDGKVHLGTDTGSTGVSANARAPLYGTSGTLIGEVSVGIRESSVSAELVTLLPSYAAWFVVMLAIGTLASFGLASILKRRTFGLELHEISRLLQEREATLHGIREGVIAVDPAGRISVVNDHARRLLGLPIGVSGSRLDDALVPGPLRDILAGTTVISDALVLNDDYCLVINRMPVSLGGRQHGTVVTLRDRTDVEDLARELAGERSLTDSLRAQQHEFTNRIHGIAGLLELDRPREALDYINEIRGTTADLDQTLRTHIGAPQIVGLMLGKAAEANERGVDLVIAPETNLGSAPGRVHALTTIVGNLIDNAFDALAATPPPRRVEVSIVEVDKAFRITVIDNGPGILPGTDMHIFQKGYTTKRGTLERHNGLGLSLVHNTVTKLGGSITVSEGVGARFVVSLPMIALDPVEVE